MIPHEGAKSRGMMLLLADQKLDDAHEAWRASLRGEAAHRLHEPATVRSFAQLKRRHRFADQPSLRRTQHIAKARRRAARALGVVFEMPEPDFEISGMHAGVLHVS
jgi:hypothetical protein